MAARTRAVRLNEDHRTKIRSSQLLNALQDHVAGKRKMVPTQVKAAEILLRKTLPDLTATTLDGSLTVRHEDALAELE